MNRLFIIPIVLSISIHYVTEKIFIWYFYLNVLGLVMISVMNSGLSRSFRARSDRHRMMKNCQIRVLEYIILIIKVGK